MLIMLIVAAIILPLNSNKGSVYGVNHPVESPCLWHIKQKGVSAKPAVIYFSNYKGMNQVLGSSLDEICHRIFILYR